MRVQVAFVGAGAAGRLLGALLQKAGVDALIVTEVYPAGEAPIAGADGKAICRAIRSHGRVEPVFIEKIDDLPRALIRIARDGDVIVTMGAGSIGAMAAELPAALTAIQPEPVIDRRRS